LLVENYGRLDNVSALAVGLTSEGYVLLTIKVGVIWDITHVGDCLYR